MAKVITKLSKNNIIVVPIFPFNESNEQQQIINGSAEENQVIAIDLSKKRKINYYGNTIKNLFKDYRIFYKLSQKLDIDDLEKIKNLSKEYKFSQIENMISKQEIELKTVINYEFKFTVKIKLICKFESGLYQILKIKDLLKQYLICYIGGGKYKITGVHNSNNQSEIVKIIKNKVKELKYTEFEIYDFKTK